MPEVDAPPLVVPEVPPQVVPEAVVPEVVPEAVVPEVVPEAVVPEVVPEAVMPQVVPEAVVPEAVVPGTAAEPSRVIDPAPVPQPAPLPEVPSELESAPTPGVGPDLALPLAPALIPAPRVTSLVRDGAQTALPPARIVLQGDAASLPQVAGGVRVNRPESTADAPDLTTPETGIINPDPLPAAVVTDGPALARFAAEFSNPEDKPLISVILIDDGGIAGLAAMLADVPFAVTVALDPADPDAATRMQTYRDMGIEVLAIAHLPDGALPSDVEVTLESVFATLPDAVGLLDIGDGGVQSSPAVTGQTLARLGADGRGLVVMSAGLNPALRAATTAGVPAGEVARDLDGDGQDAGTIRRFLDNAAFQARQKSGIILLARLKPETISALILWGTENRAAQVALAPISATLGQ